MFLNSNRCGPMSTTLNFPRPPGRHHAHRRRHLSLRVLTLKSLSGSTILKYRRLHSLQSPLCPRSQHVVPTRPIGHSSTLPLQVDVFCVRHRLLSIMHRTQTLDYCAVISGEIVLALDGGRRQLLRQGTKFVGLSFIWINQLQQRLSL